MVRSLFETAAAASLFVGRREERAAIERVRAEVAKCRGAVLLIGGEAGIGKSRLLAHVAAPAARRKPAASARADCLERAQQPLGPLRTFVRALFPAAGDGALSRAMLRAVAQLAPDVLTAERALELGRLPLDKADLFEAVTAFLLHLSASRALTLAIEDLQWADESTLDFLTYLAPRVGEARILLAITYRTEGLAAGGPLSSALAAMMRERPVRSLTLGPLDAEDVHALVAAATGDRFSASSRLLRDIETRCDGNPFFAEELLKAACASPASGAPQPLPLSIRSSILQRLAVLSAPERRVLAYAAVLGYRFDPVVLARVLELPVDDVVPSLRRFRDLDIVDEEPGDRVRCRFKHALTRQTVYDDMLAFDARRLHQQILTTIEALPDGAAHLEELAYHAWECKDAVRTLIYNERAGDAALAVRAPAEASACYRRALDVATSDGDRARLLERAGSAAQMQDRLEEAIACLGAAVDLFLRLEDLDRATFVFVTALAERYNNGALGATIVGDAEAFLHRHAAGIATPRRDDTLVFAARIAAACYAFGDANRLLASVSPPGELVPSCRNNYYLTRSISQAFAGDLAGWRHTVADLRALFGDLSSRTVLMSCYSIAKTGTFLGANDDVESAFAIATKLERELELPGITAYGASLRAIYAFVRGRLTEARAAVERALERSEVFPARITSSEIAPVLALALDDTALAKRGADASGHLDARSLDINTALVFAGRGAAHATHGRLRDAEHEMRRTLHALPFLTPGMAFILPVIARYLGDLDLPQMLELVRRRTAGDELGALGASRAMVEAIVADRLGRPDDAKAEAEIAAARYDGLDWPLFKALAFEQAGRTAEALDLYTAHGALSDVRRLAKRAGSAAGGAALSVREREIAELVAAGLTNVEIGQRLHISAKTVEKSLSAIFLKLSLKSRSQLAAVIARTAIA